MIEEPVFIIIDRATGHEYKIYRNGKIEGFPSGCVIFNRIPLLLKKAVAEKIS